jgi:hypothetical protein
VQERIGGGSFTTVKRYLDAWKQQQMRQPVVDVPAEITAQGMAAIQALWATAAQFAQDQVAYDRAEAQRQVADAQAAQYEQHLQEGRTERQTALDQVQALLVENERLTGELARFAQRHLQLMRNERHLVCRCAGRHTLPVELSG